MIVPTTQNLNTLIDQHLTQLGRESDQRNDTFLSKFQSLFEKVPPWEGKLDKNFLTAIFRLAHQRGFTTEQLDFSLQKHPDTPYLELSPRNFKSKILAWIKKNSSLTTLKVDSTCHPFKILNHLPKTLKHLTITNSSSYPNEIFDIFSLFNTSPKIDLLTPNLESFELNCVGLSNINLIDLISSLPINMKKLKLISSPNESHLFYTPFYNVEFQHLKEIELIDFVYLENASIFNLLNAVPNLKILKIYHSKYLTFNFTKQTPSCLLQLEEFHFTTFHHEDNNQLTKSLLSLIPKMKSLKILKTQLCHTLKEFDQSYDYLPLTIKELYTGGSNPWIHSGLENQIHTLEISNNIVVNDQLIQKLLLQMKGLHRLNLSSCRHLKLDHLQLPENHFEKPFKLKLENLTLEFSALITFCFAIKQFSSLKINCVTFDHITSLNKKFKSLENLQSLLLSNENPLFLLNLPQLKKLNVRVSNVSFLEEIQSIINSAHDLEKLYLIIERSELHFKLNELALKKIKELSISAPYIDSDSIKEIISRTEQIQVFRAYSSTEEDYSWIKENMKKRKFRFIYSSSAKHFQ